LQTNFPDRLLLPRAFDPARLAGDLAAIERRVGWTEHFVKQNYDGDWSAIALRAPEGATHPITMITSFSSNGAFVDTPLLDHAPYMRETLDFFQCPLQSARLMRLAPGSVIKEHRDVDLAFEWGFARLHIPVVTNADVDFRLNGRRVDMAAGSLWYLRLADPHSIINAGRAPRVHLVVDVKVDGWLEALFHEATASADD